MAKTAINESEPEIKKAINEIAANRLKRDEAVKEVLESYNNQVSSEVDARLKELEEKELTNRKESEQIGIKIFDGLVELKGILATLDSITDCDQDKKKVEVLIDKLHANMDGSMKPCVELSSQLIKATLDLKRQPGRVG
ncbi:MAG: hypothetical protein IPH31_23645 [Lewinellaceae bacterium]|nr:hypothetical protein [Lewinellaceae bacterium]